ncbi:MAG: hypothetical protein NVS2B14_00090 [Chamaesiphon sp.]
MPSEFEDKINALLSIPLAPKEYCKRWVPDDPTRNYRQVCINELAKVTGLSPTTIKNWGTNFHRCPSYVGRMLRQADLLNQYQELVRKGEIKLPEDFPID